MGGWLGGYTVARQTQTMALQQGIESHFKQQAKSQCDIEEFNLNGYKLAANTYCTG